MLKRTSPKQKAYDNLLQECQDMGLAKGQTFYAEQVRHCLNSPDITGLTQDQLIAVTNLVRSVAFRITGQDGNTINVKQMQAVRDTVAEQDELLREKERYK